MNCVKLLYSNDLQYVWRFSFSNVLMGKRIETLLSCVLQCLMDLFLRSSAEDLLPFGFPSIDMGPQLKVVERTRTATMLCAASGIPDPEISWFKDFLPVEPALSQGRIKQLRSGTDSETSSDYIHRDLGTDSRLLVLK